MQLRAHRRGANLRVFIKGQTDVRCWFPYETQFHCNRYFGDLKRAHRRHTRTQCDTKSSQPINNYTFFLGSWMLKCCKSRRPRINESHYLRLREFSSAHLSSLRIRVRVPCTIICSDHIPRTRVSFPSLNPIYLFTLFFFEQIRGSYHALSAVRTCS